MTDDPFSLSRPEGWTVTTDRDGDDHRARTVYESPGGDYRVTITEFARSLTLYWWVDMYAKADGEWHRREVGLGDSYRDPDAVVDAAEAAIERLASDSRATPELGHGD